MEKKSLFLVVCSLLVVVISVSIAYFSAQIIGEGKSLSVTSANLQVVFSDEDGAISDASIEPGWSSTKTFTVKNSAKSEYKYNIVLKDLVNTFVTTGYLQYKITSTNNGYNMSEFKDIPKSITATDEILAYSVSIPTGVTQNYTIEFKYTNDENVDQSEDMGMRLSGSLFITEGTIPTMHEKLLADKTTRLSGPRGGSFSSTYTSDNTNTLYTSTENGTTVYYFAGNTQDNWVKFGKYTKDYNVYLGYSSSSTDFITYTSLEECTSASSYNVNCTPHKFASAGDPIYWRIIRTNADGGIRLLYHSTSPTATDAYISSSTFNDTYNDPKYVGYMYDSNGTNSTIKNTIDTWYESNLKTNYGKYLSDTAVYCNDRTSTVSGSYTYFGAYTRLYTNKTPAYDCTNTEDKFTVSSSSGNGNLTYPIALMTADEVSFAGGVYANDAPAYYYRNSTSTSTSSTGSLNWYTMSPYFWFEPYSRMFLVGGSDLPGKLDNSRVFRTNVVRPVISLKGDVVWKSGDGTSENPYEIELN